VIAAVAHYDIHNSVRSIRPGTLSQEVRIVGLILLIVLIVLLIGILPTWPYSSGWGYYPSGGIGLLVVILVILWLAGYL
jgi:hypothetical protein